jgi:hypothetical protein
MIRLYRFMSAEFGLLSIRDKQVRIGRIEELNDDFEFIGMALELKNDRMALRDMRKHVDGGNGIVCMSETWESPLMWAHYAESHKGIVMGFDVPAQAFEKVEYVSDRPTLASMNLDSFDDITPDDLKRLMRMKAAGWSYEREHRAFLKLQNGVTINGTEHFFIPFNNRLRLREVIVGSRFKRSRQEVLDLVGDPTVDVFMARGDFEEFKVVRQHQDSMWR